MVKLVGRKDALSILKIHKSTLYSLAENKQIETIKIGTKYFYNIEKYLKDNNISIEEANPQTRICYCRVSTQHQKDDLERQIERMKELYPNHLIISDIGSGMNFKRKGFLKILEMIINKEVEELVVMYKDRLCRFGYEIVEFLMEKYSKGKIIIVNREEEKSPEEEIAEDILAIMTIFTSKMNGLRKYKKNIKKDLKKKLGDKFETIDYNDSDSE